MPTGTALGPKLRMPQLPGGAVTRTRLLDRLAASQHRVVLVSGPAGFGKTVLVADWLGRTACPCAWLSLDALDDAPERFVASVAAALDSLGTERAALAARALREAGGPGGLAVAAPMLDALQRLDPSTTLVLDDVHVLDGGRALGALGALLDACAAGPRLVLLTRATPALPLARLRVAGDLLEIREQDLRFTEAEAAALFDVLLPGGLDPALVRRLGERTEGWAAGLRLAAIALEQSPDRHAAVDAFDGSHRYIADYLLEEALSRQPEALQRFLLEISVLPRFTEAACVAVTGNPDAGELLRRAEAANLFLVPLGSDRLWFRMHQLVAELLQFRLRRLAPGRAHELHEQASLWFEAHGDIATAAEQAARLPSRECLAALVDRHAMHLLARSDMAGLGRWLREIPGPVQDRYPRLLLGLGWIRVLGERAPDLEPLFAAVDAALDRPPEGYDDVLRRDLRLEFDVLRAFHARFAGRLDHALSLGADVLDRLGPDAAALRGRILYNQARAWMMLGEMSRAAPVLERAIAENLRAGTHYLTLAALAQMGALLLETEGVARARLALESAVRLAEERQLTRLPAFSIVLFQLGNVLTVADELEAAVPCFEQAMALGSLGDMPDARANGLIGLARVRAAQHRFDDAEGLLLEAEAMARTTNLGLIDCDVCIPRRRHAAYRTASGLAAPPPPPFDERPADRWTVLEEGRDVCRIIEAVQSGRPDAGGDVAGVIDRVLDGAERRNRHVAAAVARTAQALFAEDGARWPLLDAALCDAAARGYARPLLELGPALAPLLQAALTQPISAPARRFAAVLLERLPAPAAPATVTPGPAAVRAPAGTLTEREHDVLLHLCRGLSNKAIARSMFVSPETVKTHVRHIYDKLDVASRAQAIARARSLNLVREA